MEENRRSRSRAYPATSLQECVDAVAAIRKELGSGSYDRHSIAVATGSVGLTGTSQRKIAALQYFGLLSRNDSGSYTLTSLTERILYPVGDEERQDALAVAFRQPQLYRELLKKFKSDARVPQMLASILVRHHGIQDQVADNAARVFVESGRTAGIIDDEGRITVREVDTAGDSEEISANDSESRFPSTVRSPVTPGITARSEQTFQFALPGGRMAYLTVPLNLTKNDIRLIEKQVEFLALQAELMEPVVNNEVL